MWSQSFFRSIFPRFPSSEHEKQKKQRKQDRRNASNSERTSQRQSDVKQNTSSQPQPKQSWWSHQKAAFGTAFAGMGAAMEKLKPKGIEVKVDVDMIKPTLVSIQKSANDTWMNIPPPLRIAIRYLAVAYLAGWIVNFFNQRTIRSQKGRISELGEQVIKLKGANDALQAAPLKIYGEGMTEHISAMGNAISLATSSAARAAEAAAVASETCAIRSKSSIRSRRDKRANSRNRSDDDEL